MSLELRLQYDFSDPLSCLHHEPVHETSLGCVSVGHAFMEVAVHMKKIYILFMYMLYVNFFFFFWYAGLPVTGQFK